ARVAPLREPSQALAPSQEGSLEEGIVTPDITCARARAHGGGAGTFEGKPEGATGVERTVRVPGVRGQGEHRCIQPESPSDGRVGPLRRRQVDAAMEAECAEP